MKKHFHIWLSLTAVMAAMTLPYGEHERFLSSLAGYTGVLLVWISASRLLWPYFIGDEAVN